MKSNSVIVEGYIEYDCLKFKFVADVRQAQEGFTSGLPEDCFPSVPEEIEGVALLYCYTTKDRGSTGKEFETERRIGLPTSMTTAMMCDEKTGLSNAIYERYAEMQNEAKTEAATNKL
jgi:hypothetical protein